MGFQKNRTFIYQPILIKKKNCEGKQNENVFFFKKIKAIFM